jgi:hypothetical protein
MLACQVVRTSSPTGSSTHCRRSHQISSRLSLPSSRCSAAQIAKLRRACRKQRQRKGVADPHARNNWRAAPRPAAKAPRCGAAPRPRDAVDGRHRQSASPAKEPVAPSERAREIGASGLHDRVTDREPNAAAHDPGSGQRVVEARRSRPASVRNAPRHRDYRTDRGRFARRHRGNGSGQIALQHLAQTVLAVRKRSTASTPLI